MPNEFECFLTNREKRIPNDHLNVFKLNTCDPYTVQNSKKKHNNKLTAAVQISIYRTPNSIRVYASNSSSQNDSQQHRLSTSSGNMSGYLENILSLKSLYLHRGTNVQYYITSLQDFHQNQNESRCKNKVLRSNNVGNPFNRPIPNLRSYQVPI